VYSGTGLSLRRNRREGYIDATFKGSWRGASYRWFLVDIHVPPQWACKHLLPPLIDNKRGESKMTPRLTALVKQVAELHDASLWACHYAEEFTLRWIRPLGRRGKLAYECSQLANPCRDPAASKILISFTTTTDLIF
jgi:hypothetical protein